MNQVRSPCCHRKTLPCACVRVCTCVWKCWATFACCFSWFKMRQYPVRLPRLNTGSHLIKQKLFITVVIKCTNPRNTISSIEMNPSGVFEHGPAFVHILLSKNITLSGGVSFWGVHKHTISQGKEGVIPVPPQCTHVPPHCIHPPTYPRRASTNLFHRWRF